MASSASVGRAYRSVSAPSTERLEVTPITVRQSSPPSPFTRCGSAEPSVSPPIITPTASPRPRRKWLAMIFSAGG